MKGKTHRFDLKNHGLSSLFEPETPNQIGIKGKVRPCPARRLKKGRKGFVTLPFLIAFVIVMFLILSFFRLTLTLTYVSVAQYITYASARRLSLGDQDKGTQIDKGEEKYNSLKSKLLQTGQWFELSNFQTGLRNDYTGAETGYRNLFYGASVSFTSNLISFRIPFLAEDGDQGLTAVIGSYLGREPSAQECRNFNDERKGKLQYLIQEKYGLTVDIEHSVESDNGC